MDQSKLFSEDIYDALSDVVRALGGPKKVGAMLKGDAVTAEDAGRWVKDCLNRNRRERFDPNELIFLLRKAREAGCHSAMHFVCDEAGYDRPKPLEPRDEMAELQRRYIDAVEASRTIAERMERLVRPGIQVVK
jgi:hypothetical protein